MFEILKKVPTVVRFGWWFIFWAFLAVSFEGLFSLLFLTLVVVWLVVIYHITDKTYFEELSLNLVSPVRWAMLLVGVVRKKVREVRTSDEEKGGDAMCWYVFAGCMVGLLICIVGIIATYFFLNGNVPIDLLIFFATLPSLGCILGFGAHEFLWNYLYSTQKDKEKFLDKVVLLAVLNPLFWLYRLVC